MYKRLWRQESLSIGAPLGNLDGGSSTRDFERWMKGALEVERLSLKRLSGEGLEWGFFTGYHGRYVNKGSEYGHLSPYGPIFGRGKLGRELEYQGLREI